MLAVSRQLSAISQTESVREKSGLRPSVEQTTMVPRVRLGFAHTTKGPSLALRARIHIRPRFHPSVTIWRVCFNRRLTPAGKDGVAHTSEPQAQARGIGRSLALAVLISPAACPSPALRLRRPDLRSCGGRLLLRARHRRHGTERRLLQFRYLNGESGKTIIGGRLFSTASR